MRCKRVTAALAAVLGMTGVTAASAETAGLYFGMTAGMSRFDLGSKGELDEAFATPVAEDLLDAGFDDVDVTTSLDDSDIGWGLQIGYRFNRYFAGEIGYVDLGEASYEADIDVTVVGATFPVEASVRFASAGPIAAAVGMLPVNDRFDIHAKAGLYFADTQVRTRVRDLAFDENLFHEELGAGEQEFFAGVGASWNINDSYSLRFEYQRFLDLGDDDSGEEDVDLLAVSMLFR
jgi:OmpA-OmpF porin, OOP family